MKSISATLHCVSVDLPGHGETKVHPFKDKGSEEGFDLSVESIADVLIKLISSITTGRVILVGYSMGARIALHMALKYKKQVSKVIFPVCPCPYNH